MKVCPNLLRGEIGRSRLSLITVSLFLFFLWHWLTSFGGNLSLHELDGLGEAHEDRVRLARFEFLAQGFDLLLEEPCPLAHSFDSADVAFEELVDVDCFLELELLEILDQLQLFLVVVDSIDGEDQDIGWLLHPALINANF